MTIPNQKFEFVSMGCLLKEEEEKYEWIVDQHLLRGGLSIFVGKPKTGKSTLVRDLAYRIATGEPFLGFSVTKGRVLYIALEEKRSEIKKQFQALGCIGSEEIYLHSYAVPKQNLIEQLKESIEAFQADIVIIDPLFRFLKVPDLNDYAQVTNTIDPLMNLARTTNCHILCVHHSNKSSNQKGDSILGSTAIFGSVDAAFYVESSEKGRTISSQKRYGEDLSEQIIVMDKDTNRLSLAGKAETDIEEIQKKIAAYLSESSTFCAENEIIKSIAVRKDSCTRALRRGVDSGKFIKIGKGTKNRPFMYGLKKNTPPQVEILQGGENVGGNL